MSEPFFAAEDLYRWLVNCLVIIIIRPVFLESRVGLGSNPETFSCEPAAAAFT